jgi:hypothetical protein
MSNSIKTIQYFLDSFFLSSWSIYWNLHASDEYGIFIFDLLIAGPQDQNWVFGFFCITWYNQWSFLQLNIKIHYALA